MDLSDLDPWYTWPSTRIGEAALTVGMTVCIYYSRKRFLESRRRELEQYGEQIREKLYGELGSPLMFVNVEEEHKALFVDFLNGFPDYAGLRGYNIRMTFNSTAPDKVGFRITTADGRTLPDSERVRADINTFISSFRNADDFANMPIVVDPVQHARLKAALLMRFTHLEVQVKMLKAQDDFYRFLGAAAHAAGPNAFAHPPLSININNDGSKTMRDSYNAENSQNVAQGTKAKAETHDSTIRIGASRAERKEQAKALQDLILTIRPELITFHHKEAALRDIESARQELDKNPEPKAEDVGNWLGRANAALKTAGAAAGVLEKFDDVLKLFGLVS